MIAFVISKQAFPAMLTYWKVCFMSWNIPERKWYLGFPGHILWAWFLSSNPFSGSACWSIRRGRALLFHCIAGNACQKAQQVCFFELDIIMLQQHVWEILRYVLLWLQIVIRCCSMFRDVSLWWHCFCTSKGSVIPGPKWGSVFGLCWPLGWCKHSSSHFSGYPEQNNLEN
jgi:hypothetical protein